MAPAAGFLPKHACGNFPLCQNSQQRNRSHGTRTRSDHCACCMSSQPVCAISDCTRRAAPGTGRYTTDLCAFHYKDPLNASRREWKLCCNSKIGCRELSQNPRKTMISFACSEGHLPCAHSLAGCPAHTCSTDAPLSQRRSCTSSRGQKCSFDPTNTSACSTPLCGQPRVPPTSAVCSDCTIGRFPCTKLCSRRCDRISTSSAAICELCTASKPLESSSSACLSPSPRGFQWDGSFLMLAYFRALSQASLVASNEASGKCSGHSFTSFWQASGICTSERPLASQALQFFSMSDCRARESSAREARA